MHWQKSVESSSPPTSTSQRNTSVAGVEQGLTEVSGIVLPAIINRTEYDQRFVYNGHTRVEVNRKALAGEEAQETDGSQWSRVPHKQ